MVLHWLGSASSVFASFVIYIDVLVWASCTHPEATIFLSVTCQSSIYLSWVISVCIILRYFGTSRLFFFSNNCPLSRHWRLMLFHLCPSPLLNLSLLHLRRTFSRRLNHPQVHIWQGNWFFLDLLLPLNTLWRRFSYLFLHLLSIG